MKYENTLFPVGNFFRTHKLWNGEKFSRLDKALCFFGIHPIYFFTAGITEHCACCRWYHSTTLAVRLRYWFSA